MCRDLLRVRYGTDQEESRIMKAARLHAYHEH